MRTRIFFFIHLLNCMKFWLQLSASLGNHFHIHLKKKKYQNQNFKKKKNINQKAGDASPCIFLWKNPWERDGTFARSELVLRVLIRSVKSSSAVWYKPVPSITEVKIFEAESCCSILSQACWSDALPQKNRMANQNWYFGPILQQNCNFYLKLLFLWFTPTSFRVKIKIHILFGSS